MTNLDSSGKLLTDTDGTYTAIIAAVGLGEIVQVFASKLDMTFILPSRMVLASPGAVNTDIDFIGSVNATISGRVVAASGGPMEGVTITATSMIDATVTYSATTGAMGTFSVSVPFGGYILSASTSDAEAAFVIPFPHQTVFVMEGQSLNVGTVLEQSSSSGNLATVSDRSMKMMIQPATGIGGSSRAPRLIVERLQRTALWAWSLPLVQVDEPKDTLLSPLCRDICGTRH